MPQPQPASLDVGTHKFFVSPDPRVARLACCQQKRSAGDIHMKIGRRARPPDPVLSWSCKFRFDIRTSCRRCRVVYSVLPNSPLNESDRLRAQVPRQRLDGKRSDDNIVARASLSRLHCIQGDTARHISHEMTLHGKKHSHHVHDKGKLAGTPLDIGQNGDRQVLYAPAWLRLQTGRRDVRAARLFSIFFCSDVAVHNALKVATTMCFRSTTTADCGAHREVLTEGRNADAQCAGCGQLPTSRQFSGTQCPRKSSHDWRVSGVGFCLMLAEETNGHFNLLLLYSYLRRTPPRRREHNRTTVADNGTVMHFPT